MFGYILPAPDHLPEEEQALFRSCYCGLCRTMGKRYGQISRLLLNYDFVFLAMLLWTPGDEPDVHAFRCPYVGCREKNACAGTPAMARAAALSVILSYWKIRDGIADETGAKKLAYRMASLFLRRAYRRAAAGYPAFDAAVREGIRNLSRLEEDRCDSLDRTADCFAGILTAAAETESGPRRRIIREVLYHVGRWIYLVDARDDIENDWREGRYNPLLYRFTEEERAGGAMDERLKTTLMHSRNLAGAAFELADPGPWDGPVRNILYWGLPSVARAVLDGDWQILRRKKLFKTGRVK